MILSYKNALTLGATTVLSHDPDDSVFTEGGGIVERWRLLPRCQHKHGPVPVFWSNGSERLGENCLEYLDWLPER